MAGWRRVRPPASAAILLGLGLEAGLAESDVLRGTRLDRASLADPDTAVAAEQELRIIRNLQAALPDRAALGLEAGRRYHLTTHGIWGFALASSRTGWEATAVGLRFVALTWAFCDFSVEVVGDEVWTRLDASEVPADVRDFLVQREMTSTVLLSREVAGLPHEPAPACFEQAAPADVTPFEEFFLGPVTFGAADNHIAIDRALVDADLPQADAHTAALTVAQCEQLLDRWRARNGIAGQVRELLLHQPQQMPSIDEVAADLHMSARTLRRRLDDEGTAFRALVDEVREGLAEALLTTAGLSIEEISRRLGYSATPAFTAAFKRWKGVSPRAYSAAARG